MQKCWSSNSFYKDRWDRYYEWKYVAEVIIECKWIDIDIYGEYDPNKHWNPRLYIENALNLYHEKINYETKNLENGFEITEKRIAKGKRKIFKKDIQKIVLIIKDQNKSDKIWQSISNY